MASKFIFKLTQSQLPSPSQNSPHYGLQVVPQNRSIMPEVCIFKLASLCPPCASPNSLNHGLKVYLQTSLITESKSITKKQLSPGGMAASDWTREVKHVRDTLVADYSAPGANTMHHVAYHPLIAVLPVLLALSVSYCN
jgi:hypothetical protein